MFHVGQGVCDDGCMGCVDCMYIHTMSSCTTTGELTTLLSQEMGAQLVIPLIRQRHHTAVIL